ncbi:hypothetical protein OFM41_31285, partial [Escherichia coli]|nr:hypothetical protein [Escherichia coli]
MTGEKRAVDVRRQIALLAEIARAVSGDGHERHKRPVDDEQSGGCERLPAPTGPQKDERSEEVADGDALQHARDA